MKNRYIWQLLLLLIGASLLLVSCGRPLLPRTQRAHAGKVEVDSAAGSLVSIRGQWDAYRGVLLYPVDFDQQGRGTPLPADPASEQGLSPAKPFATYRVELHTTNQGGYDGLLVPRIGSAMALWVNGKKAGQSGQVESSAASEVPGSTGITALFPQNGDTFDIVLQVSDFHPSSGGSAAAPILFGTAPAIAAFVGTAHGIEIALALLLGLFALLSLLRSWRTRALFLVVLCTTALLRSLLTVSFVGLGAGGTLLEGIGWPATARIGMISYLLMYVGMLASFLSEPFGRPGRTVLGAGTLLGLGGAVASLFLPIQDYRMIGTIGGGVLGLVLVVSFVALFVPRLRRSGAGRPGVLLVVGAALLVAAGVNDLLVFRGLISTGYLAPVGALLYMVFAWLNRPAGAPPSGTGISAIEGIDSSEIEAFGADLRRPLHGIVGLAESLLSGNMGDLDDEQIVSLSLIAASGLRMSNEVDDLVDRDRLQRGAIKLELTAVAVEPVVERVVDYLKPLMLVRSINFVNKLPRELPPIRADRRRLEQIFYNLAARALRAAEHGAVVVSAAPVDDFIEISIQTQPATKGKGPEAETPGAHEEHSSRMGIEVARELIRLHGGNLVTRDQEDGFSISFRMPKALGEADSAPISEELIQLDAAVLAPAVDTAAPSRGGFRILVADRDLVTLQTMRNFLEAEQYRVTTARNGEEVLSELDDWTPDMLILDALLPEIDGLEICRQLRKRFASSELPILLLVDKEEGGDLVEGMTAGASDFISKPIVPDEFLARIKTHINLAKLNTLYSRFVPVELLHFLGHDNVVELQLGDQIQREMTILFVDIRAFTNLSEGMTPQENFKFINSYLARITPIIRENNGFIDKYIGDAILALYPGSPEDALRSAIRMIEYLQEYNGYRRNSGYRPINIGIGIHTGNLIVGIIGDTDRMQGTVISDAVNLASRVQDVTKLYGANIIISQDTFVRLENPTAYNFRFLGRVKVKGKAQTVSLFEVFDGDQPERIALKGRTKQEFEDAILRFSQRKFAEAAEAFRSISLQNPNDRAAALFLNRAELFLKREKASWLLK